MFVLKDQYLDRINGFALALLVAMPVIRSDIISLPSPSLILPAFILLLSAVLRISKEGTKKFNLNVIAYFYLIAVFFLYLLISAIWHPFGLSLTDAIVKILFSLIVAFSVIMTFNIKSVESFLNWIIFFGVMGAVLLFSQYAQAGRLSGWHISSYLNRAQLIGIGALVCFGKLLFEPNCNKKLYAGLTFFLFIGLALSLARAALLTGVVLASVMLIYYFIINRVKSYSLTDWFIGRSTRIMAAFFIILTMVAATRIERTASRLRSLLGGSLGGREDLWMNSILGFMESPIIGFGLGSSGMVSSGRPTWYPHNLFFQVLIDGGIIAFVLLFLICTYPIIYLVLEYRKGRLDKKVFIWFSLTISYVFLFLEYAKSTDFYEGRVFIALLVVLTIAIREISSKKN